MTLSGILLLNFYNGKEYQITRKQTFGWIPYARRKFHQT